MLNDILAVGAGFVLWSVLWLGGNRLVTGLFPGAVKEDGSINHGGALITLLIFAALVSLAAGYVVPLISAGATLPLVLGVILLLVGIMVQRQYWRLMPLWYHLIFLVLLVPMVWLGSYLAG